MPGGMGPHGPRGGAPTEKADDLGGVLKDLMRFSRRYIPAIIVALVLGVVGTVCQIIGPDYLGDMTDEITKGLPAMINGKPVLGAIDMAAVTRIGWTLVALYVAYALCSYVQSWMMATVTQRTAQRLRSAIDVKMNKLPLKYFDEHSNGDVMSRMTDGELNILVCTTIIETGIDLPNANTLIIEDADHLGLAQLHQIRGRVGRSNRMAFAYLTYRRGKVLSETSTKRLSAIREFTSFGSGFRIAMRDLEIRGAGNVLGTSQHGHMEAVGYEMYLKLLSEAVSEQKGEAVVPQKECLVDIRIGAHIPEEYIEDLTQRIDIYKKIASIETKEDALDVLDELIDRFGEPPNSVKGLVDVSLLRNTAARMGINKITQKNDSLIFLQETFDLEMASYVAASLKGRIMVNMGKEP